MMASRSHRPPSLTTSLLLAAAALAACKGASAPAAAPPVGSAAAPPTAATPAAPAPTDDAYDTRTPVPMPPMMAAHHKQQMRDHLLAIQEITAALATDDFAAVEASAGRIAWSEEQAMMCQHMGAGTPGFGDLGEAFHHTADGIVTAARDRDRAGVLTALGATLQTCTGCHETYRQVVVADGGGMPGAGMPGAGGPGPMPGMHGGGAPGAMHGR